MVSPLEKAVLHIPNPVLPLEVLAALYLNSVESMCKKRKRYSECAD